MLKLNVNHLVFSPPQSFKMLSLSFGIFLLVLSSIPIDLKNKLLKEEFIPSSILRKLYLEHFLKKKKHGWLHKHAAVKKCSYSDDVQSLCKIEIICPGRHRSSHSVRWIASSEVCNSPAGNHSSVCTSYLICMFFPSKWTLWVNIPYSLVFKWDFTAHRVQVLVSSRACLDMWAVSMSPVLLNVFWFVLWCLSLAQVHPPCSTSHLLRTELVSQGFTIS